MLRAKGRREGREGRREEERARAMEGRGGKKEGKGKEEDISYCSPLREVEEERK